MSGCGGSQPSGKGWLSPQNANLAKTWQFTKLSGDFMLYGRFGNLRKYVVEQETQKEWIFAKRNRQKTWGDEKKHVLLSAEKLRAIGPPKILTKRGRKQCPPE
ncbi:MAG: hypothetical protein K2G78_03010 [Muribaculaceae bacterium]|nr:hypothetical protein [Muribaculaceae bacterium]